MGDKGKKDKDKGRKTEDRQTGTKGKKEVSEATEKNPLIESMVRGSLIFVDSEISFKERFRDSLSAFNYFPRDSISLFIKGRF